MMNNCYPKWEKAFDKKFSRAQGAKEEYENVGGKSGYQLLYQKDTSKGRSVMIPHLKGSWRSKSAREEIKDFIRQILREKAEEVYGLIKQAKGTGYVRALHDAALIIES